MVSVLDVAQYILNKQGQMSATKLQKLVYYAQAWSLVWDEEPLFSEKVRAWAGGPVVRELYDVHAGKFKVHRIKGGRSGRLNEDQRETIDVVLDYYGKKPGQWLSDLTHLERPWRAARKGLRDSEPGNKEITLASMAEYYGSLGPSLQS